MVWTRRWEGHDLFVVFYRRQNTKGSDYVDGVFWMCPPPVTVQLKDRNYNKHIPILFLKYYHSGWYKGIALPAIINTLMPAVTQSWIAEKFWRSKGVTQALKIKPLLPLINRKHKIRFQSKLYLKVQKVSDY